MLVCGVCERAGGGRECTLEKSAVAQELGVALAAADETAEEIAEETADISAIMSVL